MKFGKIILFIIACALALAIILLVHGESTSDTHSPLEQLAQSIENLKENYPQLIQANLCALLQKHIDKAKPMPGRPAIDLGFSWELKRRVLDAQCKLEQFFTKTINDLARLEKELRIAHDALQKERGNR